MIRKILAARIDAFVQPLLHPLAVIGTLTLIWFWPVLTHFTTQAYGLPGDSSGAIWSFFHSTQAPLELQLPQPILLGFEGWFLTKLFGEIAAYNFLSIAAFVLTAWWGYRLCAQFFPRGIALFIGIAFSWMPYHILQSFQHLGLASTQYLFLLLLFLVQFWRKPTIALAVAVGAGFALVELHDYYLGLVASVVLAGFGIAFIARYRLRGLGLGALASMIALLILLPFLWKILWALFTTGTITADLGLPIRDKAEVAAYSLRFSNFVVPPIDHPLWGRSAQALAKIQLYGSNLFEQTFWIGIVGLGLAAIGAGVQVQNHLRFVRWAAFTLIGLGVVFGVTSIGATMNEPSLLGTAIFQYAPVFRVWARFGILVLIGIWLLVGIALTLLNGLKMWRQLLVVLLGVLIAFEIVLVPPERSFDAGAQTVPQGLRRLSAEEPGATLALYPLAPSGEVRDSIFRTWARIVNLKLWNLSATWIRAAVGPEEYRNPFGSETIERLRRQGVSYVALDLGAYSEGAVPPEVLRYYDPAFVNFPPEYALPDGPPPTALQELPALSDGQIRIFRILPEGR